MTASLHTMFADVVEGAEDERIFNYAMAGAIADANPYIGVMEEEYIYYGLVYDYLIFPDEDGLQTPNLACSWWFMNGETAAISGTDFSTFLTYNDPALWPLGSIWEYNITSDVYWNDGEPFTVDDAVWTISIQIGSNFMTYWAYQPYTRWISHAEKVDDDTMRVFFKHYATNEPLPISWGDSLNIPIMPKHMFDMYPSTYIAYQWDGTPAIGTGPFMATDNLWQELYAGERVTLYRNPYYDFMEDGVRKGLGGHYDRTIEVDKLLLKFYSEEVTLAIAVRTGDADCAEIQAGTYINWLNDDTLPDYVNLVSMLSGTVYSKEMVFNVLLDSPGSLNPTRFDPVVQRAANLATNKSFLIDTVYKGLGVPGVGLISPVWPEWWWDPSAAGDSTFYVNDSIGNTLFNYTKPMEDVMGYDPDLANDLLTAAGYLWTGEEGASVRVATQLAADRIEAMFGIPEEEVLGWELSYENILYNEVFEDQLIANYLNTAWMEVGIEVEPMTLNMAQRNDRIYTYNFETTVTYWSADVDPNYILSIPTSYSLYGWNEFGIDSEMYDYIYEMQAATLDYEERKYWVDRCLEWQYLSGSLITLCYPKVCYGFNELRWTNWGDWEAHPNLAPNHQWGEPPLFYQIEYIEQIPPPEPVQQVKIYGICTSEQTIDFAALSGVLLQNGTNELVELFSIRENGSFETKSLDVGVYDLYLRDCYVIVGKRLSVEIKGTENVSVSISVSIPESENETQDGFEQNSVTGRCVSGIPLNFSRLSCIMINNVTGEFIGAYPIDAQGYFTITNISNGIYNIMILHDYAIVGSLCGIEVNDSGNLTLPGIPVFQEEVDEDGKSGGIFSDPVIPLLLAVIIILLTWLIILTLFILKAKNRRDN